MYPKDGGIMPSKFWEKLIISLEFVPSKTEMFRWKPDFYHQRNFNKEPAKGRSSRRKMFPQGWSEIEELVNKYNDKHVNRKCC